MSKYAIYRMFDGCDAPHNVEFCGHLVGSRIWTGDDDPTALMAMVRVRDGWHTEPPIDERLVLCQGKLGGFFVGSYHKTNGGGMDFYVPNYRGGYRPVVAWHELPEPYGGDANVD